MGRYGWRWELLSKQVRAESRGRCEVCGAPATNVDHIVPVSERPDLLLVRANLRATCARCNFGRVSGRLGRMAYLNRDPVERRAW